MLSANGLYGFSGVIGGLGIGLIDKISREGSLALVLKSPEACAMAYRGPALLDQVVSTLNAISQIELKVFGGCMIVPAAVVLVGRIVKHVGTNRDARRRVLIQGVGTVAAVSASIALGDVVFGPGKHRFDPSGHIAMRVALAYLSTQLLKDVDLKDSIKPSKRPLVARGLIGASNLITAIQLANTVSNCHSLNEVAAGLAVVPVMRGVTKVISRIYF